MNHLFEKHAVVTALAPQSLAAAAAKDGIFSDMKSRDRFCFAVTLGSVAAGKSVKVELLSSDAPDGTAAQVEGEAVYTAPEGGSAHHVVSVCGRVNPVRGRYLAVRVTNQAAAALVAAAILVADYGWYPEETGGTTLVV